MDFKEWSESQFALTKLENNKIQLKTPCINYTFTSEINFVTRFDLESITCFTSILIRNIFTNFNSEVFINHNCFISGDIINNM